ncbi:MAG: GAF domain-containing protein, partial [Flavobacteriales bacterium]
TRIQNGKGVCGSAWAAASTIVVEDVEKFPGHIACSSLSKSEIVVPLIKNEQVIGVLDIDSTELATFDQTDRSELEKICQWFVTRL